jgi:7-carboxy-7-deazaguanine synthase (Cx14CxxC type)
MNYAVKEIVYTLQGEGANTGRPAVFCRFAGCNLWTGREADRADAICQFCDTDFVGTDGPGGGKFANAGELAAEIDETWHTAFIAAPSERRNTTGVPRVACQPVRATPDAAMQFESLVAIRTGRRAAHRTRLAGAGCPDILESIETAETRGPHPNALPDGERERAFVVFTGGEPLLQLDLPLVDAMHRRGFEVAIETNGTLLPPRGVDWICVSPKADAPLVLRAGHELKLVYPQEGADPADYESLDFQHYFLQPMDGPDRERNTELVVDYCLRHPRWRVSLQTHKILGIP